MEELKKVKRVIGKALPGGGAACSERCASKQATYKITSIAKLLPVQGPYGQEIDLWQDDVVLVRLKDA